MDTNVILLSDASYLKETKKAGIAVFDTYSGEMYSKTLSNVKSNIEAEFIALIFSVKVAVKEEYKNPVFIYDCQSLELENLENCVEDKFIKAQFLWLHRQYLRKADEEARNVLSLAKSLEKILPLNKNKNKNKNKEMSRTQKIKKFSSYDYKHIIKLSLTIASEEEKEVLNLFLNGKYNLCELPKHETKNVDLYKFILRMLPHNKEAFLYFINMINHNTTTKKFKRNLSNIQLEEKIDLIENKEKLLNML